MTDPIPIYPNSQPTCLNNDMPNPLCLSHFQAKQSPSRFPASTPCFHHCIRVQNPFSLPWFSFHQFFASFHSQIPLEHFFLTFVNYAWKLPFRPYKCILRTFSYWPQWDWLCTLLNLTQSGSELASQHNWDVCLKKHSTLLSWSSLTLLPLHWMGINTKEG